MKLLYYSNNNQEFEPLDGYGGRRRVAQIEPELDDCEDSTEITGIGDLLGPNEEPLSLCDIFCRF